jgi:hypothetical protein
MVQGMQALPCLRPARRDFAQAGARGEGVIKLFYGQPPSLKKCTPMMREIEGTENVAIIDIAIKQRGE